MAQGVVSDPNILSALIGGLSGGLVAMLGGYAVFLSQRNSDRKGRTFEVCEKLLSDEFSKRRLDNLLSLEDCSVERLNEIADRKDESTNKIRSEILSILNKYDIYLRAANRSILSKKILSETVGEIMRSDYDRTVLFRKKIRENQKKDFPDEVYEGLPALRKFAGEKMVFRPFNRSKIAQKSEDPNNGEEA